MFDPVPLLAIHRPRPATDVLRHRAKQFVDQVRRSCTLNRTTVRIPLTALAIVGLVFLVMPDPAWAQNTVWQSLNNINSNAQDTLLKLMITVGILMIIVGAWMWKQEKGGALPVLILGLALIVVGGLTAGTVLNGIGANGGPGGPGF